MNDRATDKALDRDVARIISEENRAMRTPKPRCTCGRLADRFLHGWWVCLRCCPWGGMGRKRRTCGIVKQAGTEDTKE